jgi:xanthine dehydrogenase accessory factor
LPARRLIVAGFTPVAEALAHGARALGYDVVRVVDEDEKGDAVDDGRLLSIDGLRSYLRELTSPERARSTAIVATLGHYDEAALEVFLDAEVGFVGLVASRKRAERVFGVLAQQGVSRERLASVHNPVGIDIGARAPADVAVSILAEIVASVPAVETLASSTRGVPETVSAVDPICGMDVEVADARHRLAFEGNTYYFCCGGCRAAFAADPKAALAAMGSA